MESNVVVVTKYDATMTSLVSSLSFAPTNVKPENRRRRRRKSLSEYRRQNVSLVFVKSDDFRRKRRKRRSGSSSFVAVAKNDDVDVVSTSSSPLSTTPTRERPTEKKTKKREKKPLNEIASNLFTALKPVRLRDDDSEAAQELKAILELARSRPSDEGDNGDVGGVRERIRAEAKKKVGTTVAKYWKAKFKEFGESEAVKDAAP